MATDMEKSDPVRDEVWLVSDVLFRFIHRTQAPPQLCFHIWRWQLFCKASTWTNNSFPKSRGLRLVVQSNDVMNGWNVHCLPWTLLADRPCRMLTRTHSQIVLLTNLTPTRNVNVKIPSKCTVYAFHSQCVSPSRSSALKIARHTKHYKLRPKHVDRTGIRKFAKAGLGQTSYTIQ